MAQRIPHPLRDRSTADLLDSRWSFVLPILPFIALLTIHKACGLSDSLLGLPANGPMPTAFEVGFNWALALSFYPGLFGSLALAWKHRSRELTVPPAPADVTAPTLCDSSCSVTCSRPDGS